MKKYGHIISKLRKSQGLTQEQLGKKLNVTYQAVSKWENNLSEPDFETLERLTEELGISISAFFDMAKNSESLDSNTKTNKVEGTPGPKNFLAKKPWYLVAGLGVMIVILSLCAFLIPVKYSGSKIYEMVDPSVFCITAEGPSTKQAGSGFFINDTGLAVTNYHVIQNCTSGKIQLNNGKTYDVKSIVGCDENKDIAIIQIDIKKSKGVNLGIDNKIEVGEIVYAIGYPETFQLGSVDSTFTQGIISKTSYSYEGNIYIQTTVDMTRGNSGGVLVNQQGQVIGITTLMITNGLVDYINMAIPINKINDVKRNINVSLSKYYEMHKTFCFYSNGVIIGHQDFISGDKITKIEDPTKIGYTFGGWYTTTNFETIFDFDTPVVGQIACYAKWIPNTYTIRFNANGGDGTMNDVIATYDEELTLPTNLYQLEHYNFKGWKQQDKEITFENSDIVKNLTTENNGLITLNALWEIQKYTISFNGNNSTDGVMENITLEYDQKINLPSNQFSKTGYLFNGWTYNGQTYQNTQEVSKLCENEGTIELLADWKPITYTIRFTFEGQSYEQEIEYDKKTYLLANRFEKQHHYFANWLCEELVGTFFFDDEEEILNLTNVDKKVFEFEAQIYENYYFIRYNSINSQGEDEIRTQRLTYSQEGTIYSSNNITGYLFSHWTDDKGNIYKSGDKVSNLLEGVGDYIDLYVHWEEISYTAYYRLTYNNKVVETQYIGVKTYEEKFTAIECPFNLDGYNFDHYEVYNKTFNSGDVISRLTYTHNSTVYIDAIFTPKPYLIKFVGNGATSGTMDDQTAFYETDCILNTNKFINGDYSFLGWDYNGVTIGDGQTITKLTTKYEESITLTAIWNNPIVGDGTQESPYLIDDFNDFRQFSLSCREQDNSSFGKYYKFTNDIDFNGKYFEQIQYFEGSIDGDGHVLKNIQFNSSTRIGLIGRADWTTIKNLGIENFKYNTEEDTEDTIYAGAFIASSTRCSLDNCYATGSFNFGVVKTIYCGGLVGSTYYNWGITSSYSIVDVSVDTAQIAYVGGIMGYETDSGSYLESHSYFKECYSSCNIKATILSKSYVACIVGFVADTYFPPKVAKCFVNTNIELTLANTNITENCIMSDFVCHIDTSKITNNFTSSLSTFEFITDNQTQKLYLYGTEIDNTYLKEETYVKENIFKEVSDVWYFDNSNYPKLTIFNSEVE